VVFIGLFFLNNARKIKYVDFCGIYRHFDINFWFFRLCNNFAPVGARKKTINGLCLTWQGEHQKWQK